MDIAERFEIDAPLGDVWPLLRDIDVVAQCFPGAALTGKEDDTTYAGHLAVKFGPTTATFSGTASVVVVDDDHAATIEARGRDKRGSSRASAEVRVLARELDGRTTVTLDGAIDVHGPLGGFANTGGAHLTRILLEDFAAALTARVPASVPAGDVATASPRRSPSPPPAGTPLSGTRVLRRLLADWFRRLRARLRAGRA